METGLFEIQADQLSEFKLSRPIHPASREVVYAMLGRADAVSFDRDLVSQSITTATEVAPDSAPQSFEPAVDPTAELARCFLRLANLPNFALDRLSRYEATLWRQAAQILFTLNNLHRLNPLERRRRPLVGSRQEAPTRDCDDY